MPSSILRNARAAPGPRYICDGQAYFWDARAPPRVELGRYGEAALRGEHGEVQQMAYRVLAAVGEASGAEGLVPVSWAHLSGVNYNTIGEAGERFLDSLSRKPGARVRVRTTLNPMGLDMSSPSGLSAEFLEKQQSISDSYARMGVEPSFTCAPYDVFGMPGPGEQVAFAESNAAIHANSVDGLKTDKESAFSALASALTGKSPLTRARGENAPDVEVRADLGPMDELDWGLLGFFAGRTGAASVAISGASGPDRRSCKALCGGMGTSGTCSKFVLGGSCGERAEFGRRELSAARDELDTAERGDAVVLGSPQLGPSEVSDLARMLEGRRFRRDCMVFCPRPVAEAARRRGEAGAIEKAGARLLSDCCTCLSPLLAPDRLDAVTTNSVKGAYYLKAAGVGVSLRPLSQILEQETEWAA